MNIAHITVMIHTGATDRIYLHTDLPSPLPHQTGATHLTLSTEAAAAHGEAYALGQWPSVEIRVIDMKTGETRTHRPVESDAKAKQPKNLRFPRGKPPYIRKYIETLWGGRVDGQWYQLHAWSLTSPGDNEDRMLICFRQDGIELIEAIRDSRGVFRAAFQSIFGRDPANKSLENIEKHILAHAKSD